MARQVKLLIMIFFSLFVSEEMLCQKIGGWFTTDFLHNKIHDHAGIQLNDGNILITGGYTPFQYLPIEETEIYDAKSQKWKVAVPMNKGRAYHNLIMLKDSLILAIGGFSEKTCEILSNDYTKWTFTDSLNTQTWWGQSDVQMQDGNVLHLGGYQNTTNDTTGASKKCEIYYYMQKTWNLTNELNVGRYNQTATLLNDGRILVVGGKTIKHGVKLLNSCEVFDPGTKNWTFVSSMHYPRAGHSSTLLSNGKVLVIGGQQNISELYDPMTDNWEILGEVTLATGINKAITIADEKYLILISGVDDYILRNGWELYSLEKYESIYYEKFSRIIWDQVVLKIDNNRILVAGGEEGILSGGDPVLTSTNLCQIYDINLTGVREGINYNNIPRSFFLNCYPNPFNSSTNIVVELGFPGKISLSVYNVLGEEICNIYKGELSTGKHRFSYNMNNHSSGIYFVRMGTSKEARLIKIIHQK